MELFFFFLHFKDFIIARKRHCNRRSFSPRQEVENFNDAARYLSVKLISEMVEQ